MAYTPTLPSPRGSRKPSGGSLMPRIPVPAVPRDLAMERAERLLERSAPEPPQSQAAASTCVAAMPDKEDTQEEHDGAPYQEARSATPAMPKGIRLVRWEPKTATVLIDVCSEVVDVPKFIESELRALDSRLNDPWTIHGGFTVLQMLGRLAQAGVEVELEPKGVASLPRDRTERTTKREETKGGRDTPPPGCRQ
jgi:hypothetical protein